MTDKEQIMIDGVDVSGCELYSKYREKYCEWHLPCQGQSCSYKLDWALKQLKLKEQECEELKIYIESNEQQVKEVETLVMDNDRLINELDQLKEENNELKKKCNIYTCGICGNKEDCNKFYKTLAEIKPILEFYANSCMGEEQPDKTYKIMLSRGYIMVYDPKPARQALQKISEVENV